MPLKVTILVKKKKQTSKQNSSLQVLEESWRLSLIAVCLIELLSDSSEKNRPSIFRFVTELLLFEDKSQQFLNQDKKTEVEFNDPDCTNIFFKERWGVFKYSENVTVNQTCPELYSSTLCHQTDIPRKIFI